MRLIKFLQSIMICILAFLVNSMQALEESKFEDEDTTEITSGDKVTVVIYYLMTLILIIICFLFLNSKL